MNYANARPAGFSSDEDSDYELDYLSTYERKKKVRYEWKPAQLSPKEKLFDSVKNENLEILEEVVESGSIDIELKENGWTPLMHACFHGNPGSVNYLLSKGADVNFHKDFFTPLMAVCASSIVCDDNRVKCIELLLENGANMSDVDRFKTSPLMFAAREGNCVLIQELIKRGADINRLDNNGQHALFYAVQHGKEEAVDLLIKLGSKLETIDRRNQTVYDLALSRTFEEIAEKVYVPNSEEVEVVAVRPVDTIQLLLNEMPSNNQGENPGFPTDVLHMLQGMDMQKYLPCFIENNVQLGDFLNISDERLKEIGVNLSYHRKKILNDIKKFHLQPWKKTFNYKKEENPELMDAVIIMANVVRQLHVIQSTMSYIKQQYPKGIKSKYVNESIKNSFKFSKLLQGNLNKFVKFSNIIDKRQKFTCADLIAPENKTKTSVLTIFNVSIAVAISVVIWTYKESVLEFLKLK